MALLRRWLPLPAHRRVLDVCCGAGRHGNELARLGYEVLGSDRNEQALAAAREAAQPGVEYLHLDMRELDLLPGGFGAVVNLWQSFGYFDDATNAAVLAAMARRLAPGGRLVLDIYHRAFFEARQGRREYEKGGLAIVEEKTVVAKRLTVRVSYGGAREDSFEWRLYTPEELTALCAEVGLEPLLVEADVARPRMNLVFSRAS